MIHPLIQVAESVKKEAHNSRVAVIFDLDSTLFCVSPRTQAILRQLGHEKEFSARQAQLAAILRDIEVLPTDWGIRAVLERTQFKGSLELFHEVRGYWRKHFFGNDFLKHDTIYPSSDEYVRHLHDLGADILYLTGRSQATMGTGTREMLAHWGFPLFDESRLFMKPSDVETDESYKAHLLKDLLPKYDHIWFFENEPVIIEHVRAMVPTVHVVFVHSTHSGRAQPPAELPSIGMSYREGLSKSSPTR